MLKVEPWINDTPLALTNKYQLQLSDYVLSSLRILALDNREAGIYLLLLALKNLNARKNG